MSRFKKKAVLIPFLFIPLFIGLILAVYVSNDQLKTDPIESEKDTLEVHISYIYATAQNLSEMIQQSPLIVIGSYETFDSTWNMSRDPEDMTRESDHNYTEGRLYTFNIEEVVKGYTDSDLIKINHPYSEIVSIEETSGDEIISPAGVVLQKPSETIVHEIENIYPTFFEPQIGETYMVFLHDSMFEKVYMPAVEPFAILFDEKKMASLESGLLSNGANLTHEIQGHYDTILVTTDMNPLTDFVADMTMDDIKNEIERHKTLPK